MASTLEVVPRLALRAALRNPAIRRAAPTRCLTTASRTAFRTPNSATRPSCVSLVQQRTLFGTSWGSGNNGNSGASRNMLAYLEQTANNNPGSATAQNAFYQALIRAGMPEILVERYQTGMFASNTACDIVYAKALERIGAAESGSFGAGSFGNGAVAGMAGRNGQQMQGAGNGMSSEQLQAVGQAISARSQGGNVSISRNGSGAKNEPLYVVVDESMGSYIFKWVKFIVVFAACGYVALVVITLLIDATGLMTKRGGAQDKETKPELQTQRFADVHGVDEAKEELQEVVEFLKSPESFGSLGGKLPKGVLLSGPPGTGKTLLARAVAGEAGVPFFYMSGSEFDEIYVGVGAKRVRDLFTAARAKSPAIIFIDELDAVGGKRHARDAAYAKQTLNQLLTELDGFDQSSGVIVIGATNFPESLDSALTRPGRFDRLVDVSLPDARGRIAIINHHLKNIKVGADIDATEIARGTPGFSGADLENICNQAATHASKQKSKHVTLADMIWAKDKILMGAEAKSKVIQQKDKIATAYHEAGHALVAMLTAASDPLYKATIMPRGHALGVTFRLPEMDKVSVTRKEIEADIDVCMGGKVAEEIIYGVENTSTGASSDIQQATRSAYTMVTKAGMSELLGNVDLEHRYKELSAQTKQQIESEVRRFVEEGRNRVYTLLTDNKESLERLANALVEYETLNKSEMEAVVRGEPLPDKLKINPGVPIKIPERKPAKNGGFVMPTSSKPLQKAESTDGEADGGVYPVEGA
nr:hypothetical protein B0A51_05625 [Rachicladosporium sp. CCFEE 5018]